MDIVEYIIRTEIDEGSVIVEVGAAYGNLTTIFSKVAGENGKVYAFEPSIGTYNKLVVNTKYCKNVLAINKAVSNKNKNVLIYSYDKVKDVRYNHTYKTKFSKKINEVESILLDDYFINLKIDFILLSIQGAEGFALLGMLNIIKNNPNIKLLISFWNIGLETSGFGGRNFLNILFKLNFNIFELDKLRKTILKIKDIEYLLKEYPLKEKKRNNLTHLFLTNEEII